MPASYPAMEVGRVGQKEKLWPTNKMPETPGGFLPLRETLPFPGIPSMRAS